MNPGNCIGLSCTALRFATIYGLASRVRFDLLIHEFIRDAWSQKKLEVYGPDGWRPFLHVDDAARAVVMVCEQHVGLQPREIYNVGDTNQNYQKKTLAELIKARIPQAQLLYNHKAIDKRSYKVDFKKIHEALGFEASHSVEVSVNQICTGLESGLVTVTELEESVNVSKDDSIRKDATVHVHKPRSKL